MSAENMMVFIIRTHNCSGPCFHTFLEMPQIDLPFRTDITGNVNFKPGVLHGIKRKMLDTGYNILFLYPAYQSASHLTQMKAVLPISFLTSSPTGIIRKVYTDTGKKISVTGLYLPADRMTYFFFQFRIKGRSPQHTDRKTGGFSCSADNSPWAVTEHHCRYSFPFDSAGGIWGIIIMVILRIGRAFHLSASPSHQTHLFLQTQL